MAVAIAILFLAALELDITMELLPSKISGFSTSGFTTSYQLYFVTCQQAVVKNVEIVVRPQGTLFSKWSLDIRNYTAV